ncbi:hypothetical protein [Flammeovirga sp. SubArs3]|uniref:hypothetical protein n=1 Tax=Flammeovirga sp. SubArs3 TaxID=2995316 RepID=UPI00248B1BE7|nr:hypothetical protein [Flammeovirga sp. SubArs3]
MKQLFYATIIGLLLSAVGCQKQDPLNQISTEYLDSLYYAPGLFFPLDTMESALPEYENTYGVNFLLERFYSDDPADSSIWENAIVDKTTGVILILDPTLLEVDKQYYADISSFTVSGKRIHSKAWTMSVTEVSGELFYSSSETQYERYYEGEVFQLDSAYFGEGNNAVTYSFATPIKGLAIDSETGNISKTEFMEAGDYTIAVQVITEGGITVIDEAAVLSLYGNPELVYQPSLYKIQPEYDLVATPASQDFLEGATYELVIQDGKTLNNLSIDAQGVISLPENHNNAIDTYVINVVATLDGQEFTFENALTIEIVAEIQPEVSFAENKVTLSPWTPYTLTPELFSLPRNTTVTLETVLPEGMSFDAATGVITIDEDQNFTDATYDITMVATTPLGTTRLENLVQIVIESKGSVLFEDDFTDSKLRAEYVSHQYVIDDNERSGANLNTNADREFARAQANVWSGDYQRWTYLALSLSVGDIKRATLIFDNGVNKDLNDYGTYKEDFFSVNYSTDYDGGSDVHSFTWNKDENAIFSTTGIGNEMDAGPMTSSGLLEIPSQYYTGGKLNISWLVHKDMKNTPDEYKTGHTLAFTNVVITVYDKYSAIIE